MSPPRSSQRESRWDPWQRWDLNLIRHQRTHGDKSLLPRAGRAPIRKKNKSPFGDVSAQAAPCTELLQRQALGFLPSCRAPPAAAAGRGEQQLWGGAGALKPVGSQLPAGTEQTGWFHFIIFRRQIAGGNPSVQTPNYPRTLTRSAPEPRQGDTSSSAPGGSDSFAALFPLSIPPPAAGVLPSRPHAGRSCSPCAEAEGGAQTSGDPSSSAAAATGVSEGDGFRARCQASLRF